ncbi:MAG: replication-associated recombination protein A [Chitinophagales bacterium]|nr:replication-associated recombination protein A [Chitinophagales bacterium]
MVNKNIPLAERLRPKSLDDFIGQEHLVGKGEVLRTIIEKQQIPSMIFWGPPGVGKTTLAQIISNEMKMPFFTLSAISSGVKEVREVIDLSKKSGKAILFIDEIHRFNKAQQDSLLGAVEKGIIILIGATTENPSFEVISALLSRCQVYVLKEFDKNNLLQLIDRALKEDVFLKTKNITVKENEALLRISGGDARKLLNLFELVVDAISSSDSTSEIIITDEIVTSIAQQRIALYDKGGEQHYDVISAFIKSMRGSDPNAAVYWLARMIEGGEDPKFIARRMLILASEDIGNANPTALVLANNCFQAIDVIGYPECRIILSQTAIYLATSPKSNASYIAIEEALGAVKKKGDLPVPLHLRNSPTKLMKELNYGKEYQYAHDYDLNFVALEYLPEKIAGEKFYEPGNNVRENELRDFLKRRWKEKYNY